MIHASEWWTIETAGWAVDEAEECTAFLPCDTEEEAALLITAFRKQEGTITAEELWEMSGAASPTFAVREQAQCGAFGGYRTTYRSDDNLHWRVWWLAHDDLHLYVTFNCQPSDAAKHDAVLDWMLSSLRVIPYAG